MAQSNQSSGLNSPHMLRFIVFIVFVVCVLAVSLAFFALSIGKPYMGAPLALYDHGWAVESVDPNGLASTAGIQAGDKPVAINGQPAETFLEKYRNDGLVFEQSIRELTVVSNDGQVKSISLAGNSPSWQSVIESTTWFVVCLIFWVTGCYVFLKRPRNMAALLLCLCGLVFGLALIGNIAGERAIPLALPLAVSAATIGPWLLLHFFLVLPEDRAWLRTSTIVYLIYLPAVITLVLFPFIGYANGQPVPWFRTVRLLGYGAGFLTVVIVAVFNYFHAASPRTRQQMKIVLIGCLAALIPFLILNTIPVAIWRQGIIPSGFNLLFLGFIPLGLGYAVVTQKLMDIDIVIRRSVVYGLITLVMATILSAAIVPVALLQKSIGIPEQVLLSLALGGVATALFGPTKSGVETLVDRLLYKDRYDYRQIIQSFSVSLNSLKEFSDISRLIVGTSVHTLNLAGGCLFVRAQSGGFEVSAAQGKLADPLKQKGLVILVSHLNSAIEFPNSATTADSDVAFLIPLLAAEKEVGILCLAPKVSRQAFSSDDVFLLQGLASVAAGALRSAMLVRDVSVRDTFVSIASHELRTPLTAIMGYAELLLNRDPPDGTRKKWLNSIYDNARGITAMVDDLLNVTRIQSGIVGVKKEKVKLSEVLEEQLLVIRESTGKHEFVLQIEPGLPEVIADHDKVGQVMTNLMSNAVKYSPNGGLITITARHDIGQHRVLLSIADHGIGISAADRDSLFRTFHRIQRPETQGIRGSGLGLYIVKEWMEAMGGEVWFESELNKGSTFFVSIPTLDSKGGAA